MMRYHLAFKCLRVIKNRAGAAVMLNLLEYLQVVIDGHHFCDSIYHLLSQM